MAVAMLAPIEEYLSTSRRPDREYVGKRVIDPNVRELDHSFLQGRLAQLLGRNGLLPVARDGARICRKTVETSDGAVSIPLTGIFDETTSAEDE